MQICAIYIYIYIFRFVKMGRGGKTNDNGRKRCQSNRVNFIGHQTRSVLKKY